MSLKLLVKIQALISESGWLGVANQGVITRLAWRVKMAVPYSDKWSRDKQIFIILTAVIQTNIAEDSSKTRKGRPRVFSVFNEQKTERRQN